MKTSSKKWQKIRKIKGLRQFVTWYPRHVSENPGYKLIRPMNQELKKQGFYVIAGKIPRAFVEQKFFGMTLQAQ